MLASAGTGAAGAGTGTGPGGTASGTITTICNPFGGTTASSTGGLVANGVYYVNVDSLPAGTDPLSVVNNSVEGFFNANNPNIGYFSQNVLLSDIDLPDTYFTQGFTDSNGHQLVTSSGTPLIQYFALRLQSTFVQANWAAGDYQIATLSDDGNILTMTGGQATGSDFVISNDGAHSMQMGCTANTLHVTANSSIPLTFDWFQGPPISLGFIMLYRPVAVVGTAQDPFGGKGGNSDTFFFLDHDSNNNAISPSIAQAPYQQLIAAFNSSTGSGGWTVVEPGHFVLPGNTQNPCTKPAASP